MTTSRRPSRTTLTSKNQLTEIPDETQGKKDDGGCCTAAKYSNHHDRADRQQPSMAHRPAQQPPMTS
ncbi:hypothetical protein [Streptomyces hawaiiensis]|uniref:hypothetical protein n=1 Tax=Streptomyces hawaiiensis TaxID=67305 RepID=UPI00365EBED3